MAEPASTTALVPAAANLNDYSIQIKEYNAAGRPDNYNIAIPADINPNKLAVMLQVGLLKKSPAWSKFDVPTILYAVIYAERMGLDIMAGDVYMADEGRIATTAGAKIRHAMASGRIAGYKVEIENGEEISIKFSTKTGGDQTWTGSNLKAKVTISVQGWAAPVVYETTLAEWFVGRNPNWRSRPAYMLRRNALSKALEEVAPLGIEADEAPPLTPELEPAKSYVSGVGQKEAKNAG